MSAEKAKQSQPTGPRTPEGKRIASQNSLKHGLFSKKLIFDKPGDRAEYEGLLCGLRASLQPKNCLEEILAEEIAVCCWRLRIPLAWAERELRSRQQPVVASTIQHFIKKADSLQVPLAAIGGSSDDTSSLGWACRELNLRVTNDEREESRTAGGDSVGENRSADTSTERYSVEARLGDPMDKILRYESKLKRDLYRALAQFRRVRELNED